MRCVVFGWRNAVRCEIWCYGNMVKWPALQARAFTLFTHPPNCGRCCWRARVPINWHLADLRFRFLARQIDLKSWNHVF